MGALIGLERTARSKEAGIRTHFLVALGSALFMLVSQYGFGDAAHDVSRVASQVVSGIGFIGAGVVTLLTLLVLELMHWVSRKRPPQE